MFTTIMLHNDRIKTGEDLVHETFSMIKVYIQDDMALPNDPLPISHSLRELSGATWQSFAM